MHGDHRADLVAVLVLDAQPDEVGVVELVALDFRQTIARHEQLDVGQPFRRVTIRDAPQLGDEVVFGRAHRIDFEDALAVLCLQRSVARHGHRVGGEGP